MPKGFFSKNYKVKEAQCEISRCFLPFRFWVSQFGVKIVVITDLGSLIGNTQCGNFKIFLPLRFCVKSLLVILKPTNCHFIFTIWATLNFKFLRTFDIFKCEIFQNSKFKASQIVKMIVFDLLKSAKTNLT